MFFWPWPPPCCLPWPPAQTSIDQVSWLQGCWRLTAEGRTVDEQWMAPSGGAMMAISRTVQGGTLAEYEFVVLREREGTLVYIAHDFPQRIGYRRDGDRLDAWIDGTVNGRQRRVAFSVHSRTLPSAVTEARVTRGLHP